MIRAGATHMAYCTLLNVPRRCFLFVDVCPPILGMVLAETLLSHGSNLRSAWRKSCTTKAIDTGKYSGKVLEKRQFMPAYVEIETALKHIPRCGWRRENLISTRLPTFLGNEKCRSASEIQTSTVVKCRQQLPWRSARSISIPGTLKTN